MVGGKRYCVACSNFVGKMVDGRTVSLHKIPADKQLSAAWIHRLKLIRKDMPKISLNVRVCSEHFLRKKGPQPDDQIPSIFAQKTFPTTCLNVAIKMPGKKYCACCSNYSGKIVDGRKVSLHHVPSDKHLSTLWMKRLRLVRKDLKQPQKYIRVCSEHFKMKKGPQKGDWIPSIFPAHKKTLRDSCTMDLNNVTLQQQSSTEEPQTIVLNGEESTTQKSRYTQTYVKTGNVAVQTNVNMTWLTRCGAVLACEQNSTSKRQAKETEGSGKSDSERTLASEEKMKDLEQTEKNSILDCGGNSLQKTELVKIKDSEMTERDKISDCIENASQRSRAEKMNDLEQIETGRVSVQGIKIEAEDSVESESEVEDAKMEDEEFGTKESAKYNNSLQDVKTMFEYLGGGIKRRSTNLLQDINEEVGGFGESEDKRCSMEDSKINDEERTTCNSSLDIKRMAEYLGEETESRPTNSLQDMKKEVDDYEESDLESESCSVEDLDMEVEDMGVAESENTSQEMDEEHAWHRTEIKEEPEESYDETRCDDAMVVETTDQATNTEALLTTGTQTAFQGIDSKFVLILQPSATPQQRTNEPAKQTLTKSSVSNVRPSLTNIPSTSKSSLPNVQPLQGANLPLKQPFMKSIVTNKQPRETLGLHSPLKTRKPITQSSPNSDITPSQTSTPKITKSLLKTKSCSYNITMQLPQLPTKHSSTSSTQPSSLSSSNKEQMSRLITVVKSSTESTSPRLSFYYHCEFCKKDFICKDEWTSHMFTQHVISDKITLPESTSPCATSPRQSFYYRCTLCNKNFTSKAQLRWHLYGAHRIRDKITLPDNDKTSETKCDYCRLVCSTPEEVANHVSMFHVDNPSQPDWLKCKICSYVAPDKTTFRRHLSVHTGEKPEVCEICGKSFRLRISLTLHMHTHNETRPFACDLCDKRFKLKKYLKRHRETHKGNKPFSCEVCDMRFTARHSVATHMRVHTGEKPYLCFICNEGFRSAASLRSHKMCHSKCK